MTPRQSFYQFIASINIQHPQFNAFLALFDAFYPAAKLAEQTEKDAEARSHGSVRTAISRIEDGDIRTNPPGWLVQIDRRVAEHHPPAIDGHEIAVVKSITRELSPSEKLQADLEPLPHHEHEHGGES
jgi:hypothetical protein